MAPLKCLALACAIAAPASACARAVDDWRVYSLEASQRFGVPLAWIERVMRVESGGQTLLAGRPIVSRKGAMGLMQLMPDTWAETRGILRLGADPFDPHDNILAGAFYLRRMFDRFGYPGCFAAYNAGPGRYRAHLHGDRGLPTETTLYVARLSLPDIADGRRAPPLFVGEPGLQQAASDTLTLDPWRSLFAILPRS